MPDENSEFENITQGEACNLENKEDCESCQ